MKTLLNTLVLGSSLFIGHAFAQDFPEIKKGLKIVYPGYTQCDGSAPSRHYKKTITITNLNEDGSFELKSLDLGFNGFGLWHLKNFEKMSVEARAIREDMLNPANCFAHGGDYVDVEIKGEMVRTCKFQTKTLEYTDSWYFADKFALPVKMERLVTWQAQCEGSRSSVTIDLTK